MYDFINNGNFPDSERAPYRLIRWWLLDCYYTYCRSKVKAMTKWQKGWLPNEHELHWAYEQSEFSYQFPLEKLMLEVLTLTLNAGRGPVTVETYHRSKIAEILKKNNLDEMLKTLPPGERNEFEYDLKLLNLI